MDEKVLEIVCKEIGANISNADIAAEINSHTRLDSLNLDSLGVLEVVYELEDYFDITVDDSQLEKLVTVKDMVAMVHHAASHN